MSETSKPISEHDALLNCVKVLKRIMRDDLLCGKGRCLLNDGVVERPLFGCARDALLNAENALNRRTPPAIPASVVEKLNHKELFSIGYDSAYVAEKNIRWTLEQMGCDLRELEAVK